MEYLEIKNKPRTAFRRGIGVILVLLGIAFFFSTFAEDLKIHHILFSVAIVCTGFYHFFNGFGLERSWLRSGSDFITLKSSTKLNSVTVHAGGIREIALTRFKVIIYRKSRLPLKFDVYFLEREQKEDVYQFMTDFATKRGLKVVNISE
jgi:hypothetical protein